MKLLANLFIFIGLALVVIGVISKFLDIVVIFSNISPLAHLIFANTCLLVALILKLASD